MVLLIISCRQFVGSFLGELSFGIEQRASKEQFGKKELGPEVSKVSPEEAQDGFLDTLFKKSFTVGREILDSSYFRILNFRLDLIFV